MTTPHPTPEEGMTPEERYEALCRVFEHTGHALAGFQADAVMKSIREAEAAGEAKSDDVLIRVLASLAAAISLLERMPKAKKAAPSDKVFEQMLIDYRNALEAGRTFIRARTDKEPSDD